MNEDTSPLEDPPMSKLLLAANDIPDLQFDAAEVKEKGDSSERTEVLEITDVHTNGSVTTPQNSNFREHSTNLLESAAGEVQEEVSEQRSVQKTMDPELHSRTSEYREYSQKSLSNEKATDEETSSYVVYQMLDRRMHPGDSKNREHSQNSREKQAVEDIGNVNVTFSVQDDQCSAGDSDFLEHSQNSLPNGEPKVDTGKVNVSFSAYDCQCLAADSKF